MNCIDIPLATVNRVVKIFGMGEESDGKMGVGVQGDWIKWTECQTDGMIPIPPTPIPAFIQLEVGGKERKNCTKQHSLYFTEHTSLSQKVNITGTIFKCQCRNTITHVLEPTYVLQALKVGTCINFLSWRAEWPLLFCSYSSHMKNSGFEKNACEWIRRVEINMEEIPGSRWSMQAIFWPTPDSLRFHTRKKPPSHHHQQILKGKPLSSGSSKEWSWISAAAVPHHGTHKALLLYPSKWR